MPKMFVHTRAGVLADDARAQVAKALTELGMDCERLADTVKVRRGVWIFFSEHAGNRLFQGGEVATDPIAAVTVYALQGGLDDTTRRKLVAGITSILGKFIATASGATPVYVSIHEVAGSNWGMYGEQVSLASLRNDG